jgi:hypothetical protein
VPVELSLEAPGLVSGPPELGAQVLDLGYETGDLGAAGLGQVEKELEAWVDARAWTSGDGPKAIFNDALGWLAKRHVLLPGVTTLARLVARVRDQATERLYETLYHLTDDAQRRLLESAVEVSKGARSNLERWRKAPAKATGRSLQQALERVGEIKALGLSSLDLDEAVPHRRVAELARYGMATYAPQLRRHPVTRRVATLACTVTYLEAKAADDALELLDLLMTNDLLAKAEKETRSERTRQFTKTGPGREAHGFSRGR